MKKYIMLFLLFAPLLTYGQDSFTKGYIITHQRDTVWGLIDFKTDTKLHHECRFKTNKNAIIQTFQPSDISAFVFETEGKRYVSLKVKIGDSEQNLFLEYLVKGVMNLYYYVDTNAEYYFFENEKGKIISITKEEDNIREDFNMSTDNKYIGQLNYYFQKHKDVLPPQK